MTVYMLRVRDDLQAMGVDWEEAKSVAGDRREWRYSPPNVPVGTGGPKCKSK